MRLASHTAMDQDKINFRRASFRQIPPPAVDVIKLFRGNLLLLNFRRNIGDEKKHFSSSFKGSFCNQNLNDVNLFLI